MKNSTPSNKANAAVIVTRSLPAKSSLPNNSFRSSSFFNRLTLSKFSPSNLIGNWPHKFLVNVHLLDDGKTISEVFKKHSTGQDVFDYVCKNLDIVEKEYFGLRYQDENNHRYWVDLAKPLAKQFKSNNLALSFRVRFYPENPSLLKEEITRYQLFVQLQRDLLHGRLHCPQNEAASMSALILQSVLGDYDEEEMGPGSDYVSEYKLLLRQSQKLEERIAVAHQNYKGMSPEAAEAEFMKIACKCDTYGFDPYVVKDLKQNQEITLGTTVRGILIFMKNHKIHTIKWREIEKVDYIGKQLRIYPTREYFASYLLGTSNGDLDRNNLTLLNASLNESFEDDKKKMRLKFVCPTSTFAKHLWRHILSQEVFFTEDQAKLVKPMFSKPRIPLFSRGSTFRCPTTRVLHEIEKDVSGPRPNLSVERYPLQKQKARSEEEPWNSGTTIVPSTPKSTKPKLVEQQVDNSTSSDTLNPPVTTNVIVTDSPEIRTPQPSPEIASLTEDKPKPVEAEEQQDSQQKVQQDQAANCIESSLEGIGSSLGGCGSQLKEELQRAVLVDDFSVPVLDYSFSTHNKVEAEPRRQSFHQTQQSLGTPNGSIIREETFTFTTTPSSQPNGILRNGNSASRSQSLKEAKQSSALWLSISMCLFVALLGFVCYKWTPALIHYYSSH